MPPRRRSTRAPPQPPSSMPARPSFDMVDLNAILRRASVGEINLPDALAADPDLFSSALAAVGGADAVGSLLAGPSSALPATLPPRWTADAGDVADLLRAFDPEGGAAAGGSGQARGSGRAPAAAVSPPCVSGRMTARISDASVLLACLLEASSGEGGGGGGSGGGAGPAATGAPPPAWPAPARHATALLPDDGGDDDDDDGPLPLPSVFGGGRLPVRPGLPPGVAAAAAVAAGVPVPPPLPVPGAAGAARAAAIARQRAKRRGRGETPAEGPPADAAGPSDAAAPPPPPKRARAAPPAPSAPRGRTAPAHVDAAFAAAPVEEAALSLPPGLTDAERKRELRKAKNRASALASRLRREGHAAALEARVAALEREKAYLEASVAAAPARDARADAAAALAKRGGAGTLLLGARRSTRVAETQMKRHLTL